MEYSIVENGVVINVVIADTALAANWYEGNHGIGALFDGVTFTQPPQPTPKPIPQTPIRITSKLEYMNRFTDAELAAIYTAAKSVISVEIWLEKFKLASEIDLDDPRTIGGVRAMEAAGLLATGRAAVILA